MPANMQRGQVRIQTDVGQAHVDAGAVSANLPSAGEERAMARISGAFEKAGDQIGRWADHAAAVEGNEAGKLAGLDPEFRPTKSLTLRGEAFDRAGLQVYETRTRTAMLADMQAVYDKHGQDPQGLSKALAEKRSAWVNGALTEVKADLANSFDAHALALNRQAARAHLARVSAEQHAAAQDEASEGLKRIHQLAYGAGLDDTATEAIASERANYARTLSRRGANGQQLFTPEQRQKMLRQFDETTTTARIYGAFERTPGLAAKQEFVKQFDADFAASRGLAAQYDLKGHEAISGHLRAGLSRAKSEASMAVRGVHEEVKAVRQQLEAGATVPPEQIAAIEGRVAASGGGTPELASEVSAVRGIFNIQSQLRDMPPEHADRVARAMRAEISRTGTSPERQATVAFVERYAKHAREGIERDPLGWAAKTDAVPVTPLDFANPQALPAQLRARMATGDEVAARFGRKPQYLRPDEKRQLSAMLAKGGAEAIAVATTIAAGAPERASAILGELDKQHAGHLALLGTLVATGGDEHFVRLAANGLAFAQLPDKKKIADLKPADVNVAADDVTGTALGGLPASRSAAIALTNHAYEMVAQQKGLRTFDADEWKKLYRQALGERTVGDVTYGGVVHQGRGWFGGKQNMIVVPPNMRQDRFMEFKDSLRATDLIDGMGNGPRHGDGTPATLPEVQRATLIQAGGNRYYLSTGVDERQRPRVLLDGSGAPYVLDMGKIEPEMRRRRPDLYLGGQR